MSIGVRVERKDNLVLTIPLITDNYTVNDLNSLQELFTEFADDNIKDIMGLRSPIKHPSDYDPILPKNKV